MKEDDKLDACMVQTATCLNRAFKEVFSSVGISQIKSLKS